MNKPDRFTKQITLKFKFERRGGGEEIIIYTLCKYYYIVRVKSRLK